MRTGKHRAHEDFQVYNIDVFYNDNLIVAGFFSRVFHGLSPICHLFICCVWYSVVKELIYEVYNSIHLHPFSVFALTLTLSQSHVKRQFIDNL